MNEMTIKLLFLGLPGIVCLLLTYKLIGRRSSSQLEVVLLVAIYAALPYSLMALLQEAWFFLVGREGKSNVIQNLLSNESIPPYIILFAAFAGVVQAVVVTYIVNYGIINRIGQRISATNRYGDEDVWNYFHNTPDDQKNDGWLIVRDYRAGLAYFGYIRTWSDSEKRRELVMSDVSVYTNETSEFLYEAEHLYLCREHHELSIEVPPQSAEEHERWKVKEARGGENER